MTRALNGLKAYQKKHRRTLTGHITGFPEFSFIGYDIFTKVDMLPKHEHPKMFEFCLILRGHVTWWAQEKIYELRGGDVYFTWPDEPHGGLRDVMHPCAIYWTIIHVPRPGEKGSRNFLHLPAEESLALCEGIHTLKDRHLRGAEKLEPYYQAIFQHLESDSVLGITQARAAMQGLLATLAGLPLANQSESGFIPPGISRAREFLDGCPRPWPTVAELADLSGMSSSHFHACFLRDVGMAPMEYAHRARLARAQRSLAETGSTVTSTAAQLGYCSSQHLAVCYKRYLGSTPKSAKR